MKIQELNKIIKDIDVIDLLEYSGNPVTKTNSGYIAKCPFHAEGADDSLTVDTKTKILKCNWCEFEGNVISYINKIHNFKNGDLAQYFKTYFQTQKQKLYEIVRISKHEMEVKISDRYYTLVGVKYNKLMDMNVTVKVTYKDLPPFFDTVNLIKHNSRNEFVKEVKEHFFISQDIIAKDIDLLSKIIEKKQRDFLNKISDDDEDKKKVFTITQSEENKALDILSKTDIFKKYLFDDLEKLGYVGDEKAKQILYLASISRRMDSPISVLSLGGFSSGKSLGQNMILSLTPDDEYYAYGRLSPKALSHFTKYQLKHKVFAVDEFKSIDEESLAQFREILSFGKTSTAVAIVDRLTGQIQTITKEVYGPISMLISATHLELDEETKSRFLILPIDDSVKQNQKVIKAMINRSHIDTYEKQNIMRKHKILQKTLSPVTINFPKELRDKITFPHVKNEYKRILKNFLSFIYTIAYTRQYQKTKKTITDKNGEMHSVINIDKRDITDAVNILKSLYGAYMIELDSVYVNVLKNILSYCLNRSKDSEIEYNEVYFSKRDIWLEYKNYHMSTLKKIFNKLIDEEYIVRYYDRNKSNNYYKLNVDKLDPFNAVKMKVFDF